MNDEQLASLIKKSIREVIQEERLSIMEILIPYVSKKEMDEILQKQPTPKIFNESEFVDMTDWVKK
ncbi:MAG: hypothetical protein GXO74_12110 [Calditrichaeota bacterium]|nr:hypothetical protein [Calditrichota bacterium]